MLYTGITYVKHVYYSGLYIYHVCMSYVYNISQNTTHVLHMHHTCNAQL